MSSSPKWAESHGILPGFAPSDPFSGHLTAPAPAPRQGGKAIAKYETGVILPSIESLKRLAAALEVSSDHFLSEAATPEGIPKVNDPELYERYFILEALETEERKTILTVLDSVVARQKLRELTGTLR